MLLWQHFLKGPLSKRWNSTQLQAYSEHNDIDKHKYTINCWYKRLTKAIIEGCIRSCNTWNTSLHGDTTPDTIQVRLQRLKVRVAKAHTNDKGKHQPHPQPTFQHATARRLKHHTVQLQKWLDTVQAAKQIHTLISTTHKIKIAYNRFKLRHSYMTLFNTSLRAQLYATFQEQARWIQSYNDAVTVSAITLQHCFHPPGGPTINDFIPWAI